MHITSLFSDCQEREIDKVMQELGSRRHEDGPTSRCGTHVDEVERTCVFVPRSVDRLVDAPVPWARTACDGGELHAERVESQWQSACSSN